MASMFGTTSFCQNSSVVFAMARCSSVKSSGVKISSGELRSRRNAPPLVLGIATVVVAIIYLLIQIFENPRSALAAADAHCYHAVFYAAPLHLAQNCRGEFRSRAAQRMTQCNGAAVDI